MAKCNQLTSVPFKTVNAGHVLRAALFVSVDRRITLKSLKAALEPHVGTSVDNFKVAHSYVIFSVYLQWFIPPTLVPVLHLPHNTQMHGLIENLAPIKMIVHRLLTQTSLSPAEKCTGPKLTGPQHY